MKKTISDVLAVLDAVHCPPYKFSVSDRAGGFALLVTGPDDDMRLYRDTPVQVLDVVLRETPWFVSSWSTDSEIVRTAFKAVKQYVNSRVEAWSAGFAARAMSCGSIDEVAEALEYKDTWRVGIERRDGAILWKLMFDAADNDGGGEAETQHCRKHIYANEGTLALARRISMAIADAEEHELCEQFKIASDGGRLIDLFNPHINLRMLANWADGCRTRQDFYDIRPVMDSPMDSPAPNESNTVESDMADFFFSQWKALILSKADRRKKFAAWNGMTEHGPRRTVFSIDYDKGEFTPLEQ